jgi:flagellar hook protein FlgE
MIDSIQLALSGMLGFQRGLDVISNNVSNLNTPGFRGSGVDFVDLFNGPPPDGGGTGDQAIGDGVNSSRTLLDTTPGQPQTTGRDLDLFLQGSGWFVVKDQNGLVRYTRNGSFDFDTDGNLVIRNQQIQVMAMGADGQLAPVNIGNLRTNPAKPTTKIAFDGNLSPGDPSFTVDGVTTIDKAGNSHTLRFDFSKDTNTSNGNLVDWNISVTENGLPAGSGSVQFVTPQVAPGSTTQQVTLTLSGGQVLDVTLDFSAVLGNNTGSAVGGIDGQPTSTLALQSQDGVPPGSISAEKFDVDGVLQLTYTNGQTASGPTLALADLGDPNGLVEQASSLFSYQGTTPAQLRKAGPDLQVQGQTLEGSNVDLTTEFSKIILMQRGYQAASEVVSTANDMLQKLLDMRGAK